MFATEVKKIITLLSLKKVNFLPFLITVCLRVRGKTNPAGDASGNEKGRGEVRQTRQTENNEKQKKLFGSSNVSTAELTAVPPLPSHDCKQQHGKSGS